MKPYRLIVATALSALAGAAVVVPVALSTPAQAAPPTPGPIVKLWNWNWNSVARECTDVLGPAGYSAVQVSPPSDSMSKGGSVWWDIYQPARYTLTSKFGDENAFRNMVNACHAAGVKVHADAVINHMTGQGSTSYGGYSFGKYNYPGLYSSADFHSPTCGINGSDYKNDGWRVQNCELVGLSDLNTGSEYVRDQIAGYLNKLTSLGVDGFRIDAAKHINPGDLAAIKGKLTGSPYIHQEVIQGDNEAITPSQYTGIGDVHEFVYGRKLKEQFAGQIKNLQSFGQSWGLSVPSDKAVVFIDNHDTERNGSTMNYKYGDAYKLANVFMLAWPYGTQRVYSGFTWGDSEGGPPSANGGFVTDVNCGNGQWTCFHRQMSGMVGFNRAVAGTSVGNWYDNGNNVIAFSRGNKGWVAINNESGSVTRTFSTGLPAGTYSNDVGGGTVTVDSNGSASVTVPGKSAVAIHVGGVRPTDPPPGDATVYYSTTWADANIHYQPTGGAWTAVPGVAMNETACAGWKKKTVALGTATGLKAAFNNGSGTWDNNGGSDYTIGRGVSTVKNGVVTANATSPCGPEPSPTPTVNPGKVATSFNANVTTSYGQNVFVVGDIAELGSWNPANAVALSSADYPVWKVTANLPANTAVSYKYIKKNPDGSVTWESDPNRSFTTPASGTATRNDSWR
ncbi:carbohydrate-binding module family 20 domain-containing protein [Streptosporangium sp. NPDC001681]|uniref:carbohydrate-binding module family 20 domain-containing protein n=1 Tax=Streptosporangium sp. NPDC001681 TaxID=3154395 RepID=UPI00331C3365